MKWGKRKKSSSSTSKSPVRGKTAAPQLKPISKDAKNAEAFQKVAKTQGTQALTNQQLQALVNRQNLERQYSQLNPKALSNGEKFMKNVAPTLLKAGVGAYKSMQPQSPATVPSKEVDLYTTPSTKRIVGQVLGEVGKTVISAYGQQIAVAAGKQLMKSLL